MATVNLGCALNLRQITLHARNAEYNPKRFAAVIMRIHEPKTTALFFSSGKMVCTGAKSEESARLAARKFARIIQKLGFPAQFREFKVQTIVSSCDVKLHIRLEQLEMRLKNCDQEQLCSYEPELFPGLVFKLLDPKVTLLIFVSGKIVLTGAKEKLHVHEVHTQNYCPFLALKMRCGHIVMYIVARVPRGRATLTPIFGQIEITILCVYTHMHVGVGSDT